MTDKIYREDQILKRRPPFEKNGGRKEGINTWRWKPEHDAVRIRLCSCLFPCLLRTVLYTFSLCKFHAMAPLKRQMDTSKYRKNISAWDATILWDKTFGKHRDV
jgi:hypothetical protein